MEGSAQSSVHKPTIQCKSIQGNAKYFDQKCNQRNAMYTAKWKEELKCKSIQGNANQFQTMEEKNILIKCNGLQNGLRGCSEQCHGKLSFKAIFSNVLSPNLMGVKTLLSAQHIGDLIDVKFLQNHKSLNEIVWNLCVHMRPA